MEKMKHHYYTNLEIPSFEDCEINKEEIIKCKNVFEKIAILMRDEFDIFEIHLAYYTSIKIKESVLESMNININIIREEFERRKNENTNN